MKKPTIVIASAVVVALAFGGGAFYYKAQQAQEISALAGAEESVFVRAASPSLGAESAIVQLVEFFDPACESCRMMYPYVKSLMRANDGKLRLTLRYATFHEGSDYVVKVLGRTCIRNHSKPSWPTRQPGPNMGARIPNWCGITWVAPGWIFQRPSRT